MNPEAGTTGNTLFYINEQFTNKEAVGRHVENAQKNPYFEKFGGIMKDYGVAVGLGTDIYASIRNKSALCTQNNSRRFETLKQERIGVLV